MNRNATYRKAPGNGKALQSLLVRALDWLNQGRTQEAEAAFLDILKTDPNNIATLYSLGLIYANSNRPGKASELIDKGIKMAPRFAQMWNLSATRHRALGQREEALECYQQAINIDPGFVEAINNWGTLLHEMHRPQEALEKFQMILRLDPKNAIALKNCGIMLREFKRSTEAVPLFEKLLELDPEDSNYILGLLCCEQLKSCDWSEFERIASEIEAGLKQGRRVCRPLGLFAITDSASDHYLAAKMFAGDHLPKGLRPLWQGERYDHRRIRLAYVSPDFREHPVGQLIASVLERHDKSRFETIAISLGTDDQSQLRQRIVNSVDKFIDARAMASEEIARLMRDQEIDIAIDLAGYTSGARAEIFCHRVAPAQVNYLGYPGTMGSRCMDYIVADRHVIPPEMRTYFAEEVLYMPHSYLPADGGLRIAEITPSRQACGLPDDAIVLCSFGQNLKKTPAMFERWLAILARIPNAVLWLSAERGEGERNLRQAAQAKGIDSDRLIFAERMPRLEDHLARYRLADLFLDTFPYNAHTTAADALLVGLPVLTCMGSAFPSRVAGSLLNTIGLSSLITNSLQAYEDRAVELLSDSKQLLAIKQALNKNRHSSPLFDAERFCRDLEYLYSGIHERN